LKKQQTAINMSTSTTNDDECFYDAFSETENDDTGTGITIQEGVAVGQHMGK
jgi:hypothetical protein